MKHTLCERLCNQNCGIRLQSWRKRLQQRAFFECSSLCPASLESFRDRQKWTWIHHTTQRRSALSRLAHVSYGNALLLQG